MSKEMRKQMDIYPQHTNIAQGNGNDFIADVIISLPMRERIEFIYNATKKAIKKRKEQGFPMTKAKRDMYEMGFRDAIEWLLGNEL